MLHAAPKSSGDFLVLTHGASGNMDAALLVALADALPHNGINVLRCDLPYRQRHPHGPPSPATAKDDQEGLRRAIALMKDTFNGRAFLGGSSYGGRQASLLVAILPWSKVFSYSRTPSILPASPPSYGLPIFPSCERPLYSSAGRRTPSAPSRN